MSDTLEAFGHDEKVSKNILIVGGGNIGFNLAKNIEETLDAVRVKIIEKNKERAEFLASELNNTIIINYTIIMHTNKLRNHSQTHYTNLCPKVPISLNGDIKQNEYSTFHKNQQRERIKEENLNTKGLVNFMETLPENKNSYFATHPRNEDRVNLLKNLSREKLVRNSAEFNWIKSKYGNNSEIDDFNKFFIDLEKGIISQIKEKSVPNSYFNYEIYKKGIGQLNNEEMFQELYSINDNSFLKIEYFNYIIDNQLSDLYELIEKNKQNKAIQKEYYFHYIYGKYYAKRNNLNLSNFYFCQFFKSTNLSQKIDYYCNNYDKNKISNLDNSYALSN